MADTRLIVREAHFPGRAPIDAYGDGGFRFAEMSHRGSILCLPSGTYGWDPGDPAALVEADFAKVFSEANAIEVMLIGTGTDLRRVPQVLRERFRVNGISVDSMSTGAAVRTFNVLLAEERAVAAAMLAVD